MLLPSRRRHLLTLAVPLLVLAVGCRARPFDLPQPSAFHPYTSGPLGVTLEVPDFLQAEEIGDSMVVFRYEGRNAALLRWFDEQEGRRRGIWYGHPPAGHVMLAGRPGLLYHYEHDDGPIWDLTDAYVVPYRGKQLGLEFRTRHDAAVRERMLRTFRFVAPAAPTERGGA
jgi:hypothetical protein